VEGRQIRGIKGEDAIKAFVRAGGVLRQGRGSHANIKMPNGAIITIPRTGDLKVGLLKAAIRRSGLMEYEFLELV
jgi:predicted RNA binding protein YcfA (HicA-like mRNA interferase family)